MNQKVEVVRTLKDDLPWRGMEQEHAPEAHWGFQKIQPLPTAREEPIAIPLVDRYFGWERFLPEGKKKKKKLGRNNNSNIIENSIANQWQKDGLFYFITVIETVN